MANWCTNWLNLSGPYEDVKRFYEEAQGQIMEDGKMVVSMLCFHKHVPVPEGENGISKWGCKWEPDSVDVHSADVIKNKDGIGEVQYTFGTAWTPPLNWFEEIIALYPTIYWELKYEEPDNEIYGKAEGTEGDYDHRRLETEEWLLEEYEEYGECIRAIKNMSQDELIKYFSGMKDFSQYICDDEELENDPELPVYSRFEDLAGTIIEAIETRNLPLFMNVDWGCDHYNDKFKSRMKEGK